MKVEITGTPKEIAALVLEPQGKQVAGGDAETVVKLRDALREHLRSDTELNILLCSILSSWITE